MYDDFEEPEYRPRLGGTFWLMVGISVALFWVPGFNGLIAGLVGGHRAGSVPRAFGLSVAATIATAAIYGGLFTVLGENFSHLTYGINPVAYIAMTGGLMIVSAVLSPLIERRPTSERVVTSHRRPLFRRRATVP